MSFIIITEMEMFNFDKILSLLAPKVVILATSGVANAIYKFNKNDNFQCRQWQTFCQNCNISVSLICIGPFYNYIFNHNWVFLAYF